MYTPSKQRHKQSLKVRLTTFFRLFFELSSRTPLQKGLSLGERPNPLFYLFKFCLCVCYILGVS